MHLDFDPSLPKPTPPAGHMFFFGLGYTALRLAARLMEAGWQVYGTVRDPEKAARVKAEHGIEAYVMTDDAPIADPARAFEGVTHVIDSIPPGEAGDTALLHHADDLRACGSLRWIGYLSTPAVYGDRQGGWVREEEAPTPGSARGQRRADTERAWRDAFEARHDVAVQVFRIAGIYGPGPRRNALESVRNGGARIIDKPGQVFNRIHVDDIGSILLASMERPRNGGIYNVADTEACDPGDPIRFACGLLGVEPPAPIPFDSAELSDMARSFYSECKRLDTSKLTEELGVRLTYPTYRQGLESIFSQG